MRSIKSHNATRRVSIVIWVKLTGVLSLIDFARIFRFRCHKAKGIPFPSLFPNDLYPMAKVKRKIVDFFVWLHFLMKQDVCRVTKELNELLVYFNQFISTS